MASIVKPLASTTHVVEWEELPPSVKSIPTSFNPLKSGILMQPQIDWLAIKASIKLAEKGRRTGITFATAYDKTLVAASTKEAGGRDVFYIGDTKEKGLEFIGYVAKFARIIAEAQIGGISEIEEFLFADQDEKGNTKYITSYRVRFSSGFKIVALSSRPANIRGLQGDVVIDEAAFHPDVQGVLDAATALLIWGGNITIISSHNGIDNPFNTLKNDIQAGRYGDDAAVFRVTFDDAVKAGLYERVCLVNGWTPTPEGKEKWYKRIRSGYGTRRSAMLEELDAIPQSGSGVVLPSTWIERAMREERPVLRLALPANFIDLSPHECKSYIDDWIKENLEPLLKNLDPKLRHILAQDFARHRDFSIIGVGAITSLLELYVPFIIELHKVPYREQEQIVKYIIDRLPRFSAAAFDATGNGEALAEEMRRSYGSTYIHEVKLSQSWYGSWTQQLINLFQDGYIDLPRDENIQQDLRQIVNVDGVKRVPAIRLKDLKDPDLERHGDSAIMLILLRFAMLNINTQSMEVTLVPRRHGEDNKLDDIPDNSPFAGNW